MFSITNKPCPQGRTFAPRATSKYKFNEMQTGVGYAMTDFVNVKKAAQQITSAVGSYRKRSGDNRKFTVRAYNEDGINYVGVWVSAPAVESAVATAPAMVVEQPIE